MSPHSINKPRGGLRLEPKDPRNLKLGALVTLPALSELPESFVFPVPPVEDQQQTDYCSAFATCYLSELQEGVDFEPSWSFAVSKMISGDPESWGRSLMIAMQAHRKHGALKKEDAPMSLSNTADEKLRFIENWPKTTFEKAYPFRKKTFYGVTGPYDHFDNIRATIWKFRAEKRGTLFGVEWGWGTIDPNITKIGGNGFGHALAIIGFTKDSLVILNSYGKDVGSSGLFYFSREVVNHFAERYGAFMFLDIEREDAEYKLANGIRLDDNWVVAMLKMLYTGFRELVVSTIKLFTPGVQ